MQKLLLLGFYMLAAKREEKAVGNTFSSVR